MIGQQTVRLIKNRHPALVIAQQSASPPGGDPEPVFGVFNDGTDPVAVEKSHKILFSQICTGGRFSLCKGHFREDTFLAQNDQSRVRSDPQFVLIQACGVDDLLIQSITLENIREVVGHDLHHALPGRGKPEIALIVLHNAVGGICHRQIPQIMEFTLEIHSDSVSGEDPDRIVDLLDIKYSGKGRNINRAGHSKFSVKGSCVKHGLIRSHVDYAGLCRIGSYFDDMF